MIKISHKSKNSETEGRVSEFFFYGGGRSVGRGRECKRGGLLRRGRERRAEGRADGGMVINI